MTADSNNAARRAQCSICSQLEDHAFGRQTHGRPEEDTFLPDVARRLENVRELKPGSVRYAWGDLSRVVNQVRFRPEAPTTKVIWRTEIQFKGGESAWLIPAKVSNYREAREYVDDLPCEHTEVRV